MTRKLSRRERVARLRDLMQNATDLSKPVNYFSAKLAGDRKFIRQSKPGDPELDEVLRAIAQRVFGPGTPIQHQRFLRYGQLWHGVCFVGPNPAVVLYHAEIDTGILTVYTGRST
jgi:hypothetical protein